MKYFWLVPALGLLAACSKTQAPAEPKAPADTATQSSAPTATADAMALKTLFGSQVELASGLPAAEFRADFTGDNIEDRAYLVNSSTLPASPTPDVQVLRPWQAPENPATDLQNGAAVSLVIANGAAAGSAPAKFIVHDDVVQGPLYSAINIGIQVLKPADLSEFEAAKQAKGAALSMPLETGDQEALFWNGASYEVSVTAREAE